MADIKLTGIDKVYPGGTHAVHGVDLHIADGEFMIMVGPSGCAKSTILRMIAGLEVPTGGTVEIGGRVVNDVAPKDRDIAMVFQSYALYPHMTVAENMAFGLRLRKMPPNEIEQRVNDAARILGLESLLDRKPKAMSGGQRQRVAMGRAIVREPQAFLMDEPLSNLDAKLRVQMRTEIAKLHQRLGVTTVYVTHDQVEAMTLGQRICILRKGLVQQVDTPYMVYTNPANVFVGGFIGSPGMNFMNGHLLLHDGAVWLQLGETHVPLPASVTSRLVSTTDINGRGVIVGIRPEHLHEASPHDPHAYAIACDVELVETMGSEAYAYFTTNVAVPDLTELSDTQAVSSSFVARLGPDSNAQAGQTTWLRLDLEQLHVFDPSSMTTLLTPLEARERGTNVTSPSLGDVEQVPNTAAAYAPPVLSPYTGAPTPGYPGVAQTPAAFAPDGHEAPTLHPVINLHQTITMPAASGESQSPAVPWAASPLVTVPAELRAGDDQSIGAVFAAAPHGQHPFPTAIPPLRDVAATQARSAHVTPPPPPGPIVTRVPAAAQAAITPTKPMRAGDAPTALAGAGINLPRLRTTGSLSTSLNRRPLFARTEADA